MYAENTQPQLTFLAFLPWSIWASALSLRVFRLLKFIICLFMFDCILLYCSKMSKFLFTKKYSYPFSLFIFKKYYKCIIQLALKNCSKQTFIWNILQNNYILCLLKLGITVLLTSDKDDVNCHSIPMFIWTPLYLTNRGDQYWNWANRPPEVAAFSL